MKIRTAPRRSCDVSPITRNAKHRIFPPRGAVLSDEFRVWKTSIMAHEPLGIPGYGVVVLAFGLTCAACVSERPPAGATAARTDTPQAAALPTWKRTLEPTYPSVVRTFLEAAGWLREHGYPDMSVVDAYTIALQDASLVQIGGDSPVGVSKIKTKGNDRLPKIVVNPEQFYREHASFVEREDYFLWEVISGVVGEAWGWRQFVTADPATDAAIRAYQSAGDDARSKALQADAARQIHALSARA